MLASPEKRTVPYIVLPIERILMLVISEQVIECDTTHYSSKGIRLSADDHLERVMNTKMANLTICYEGIQRIYRNVVVVHIRDSMKKAFPSDYIERIKRPFLKEWDSTKVAAEERRATGELQTSLIDEIDILGVNHFFNIFEVYAEHLVPYTTGSDEDRRKAKKVLLGWMQDIKSLRDPLSHPSEADLNYDDSFVLLDRARRVLIQLGYKDFAERINELQYQLGGGSMEKRNARTPLEDRLPPRETIVVRFVGRADELSELQRWFDDPLSHRWAVVGAGGLGKSALAYAFAEEIRSAAPQPYQLVTWMSAKRRRFDEGQVVSIADPDFCNLDTALSHLLMLYGWHEEAELPLEKKRVRAIELLNEFPALVVVDDID
jgi:hypothetical protein